MDSVTEEQDWYAKAREIVLRRLSVRARSCAELRVSLTERGIPEYYQQQVLDRFSELGLVDDEAFARALVAGQLGTLRGRRAIAHKLRAKGIGQDLIDAALVDVDEELELELAISLVKRRWGRLAGLERSVRIRRLMGLLGRRGFSGQTSRDAVRHVEESTGSAEGPGAQPVVE